MDRVKRIIDHAERQCKKNGSRFTEKRKLVLLLLVKSETALSAYELANLYKTEFGEVLPVMSIYRILKFLMAEDLAHRLGSASKYVACAHINCEHSHAETQFLICSQCQKVKEISISESIMQALKKSVKDADFHLASARLEMSCICQACAAKSS